MTPNYLIKAIVTDIMYKSDFSTQKHLSQYVNIDSEGLYVPKNLISDDELHIVKPSRFDKWILTNLCLLAHQSHILKNDDVFANKFDCSAYNCVKVVQDLSKASVVTLVSGTTILSKPIFQFDFQTDGDNIMSPAEFNAFQLLMSKQAKQADKSPFANGLAPLSFQSVALTDLRCIYVDDVLKSVNPNASIELSVLTMHVSFDTDSSYLEDARDVEVKEAILNYARN